MSAPRGSAPDAVVVGAGHNGLVAANLLVDAGWDVVVLEANDHPGGAVFSDRSLHPDYVTDWYSAFYPLGAASPVIKGLDLAASGLRWTHAPHVLTHVLPDGRGAVLGRDEQVTAASVDAFAAGDGGAWLRLVDQFDQIREPLIEALFTPFPPVRSGLGLARRLGAADLLRFARFALTPVRRATEELFAGEGAALLLAGNALHTDLPPEAAGSALYGWLLAMLGQTVGFPVPVGGAGALVDALVARFEARGGTLRCGVPVTGITVVDGAATGVDTADGHIATRAVLADVGAPALFGDLIGAAHLPPRMVDDLRKFQWDAPTLKLDWALSGPIPWTTPGAVGAGTVHLGVDMDGLTRYASSLALREKPREPFVLLGQMTTSDPTRSPAGTESAWAYTHLPPGVEFSSRDIALQVRRVEAAIERVAPGFADLVVARQVQSPADLEGTDRNLVRGAVGGGTSNLHQQLVFRPVPGMGRPETPVDGVYLASASAHPGGGVHGAPGANAARAAIARAGRLGGVRRRALDAVQRALY